MLTRFLFVTSAVATLTLAAGAQIKSAAPVKNPLASGYFPPPGGSSSALLAGGSDNCANAPTADAISGTGTFNVSNTGATDSGYTTTCATSHNDVWFYWTAPTTGTARVQTCNLVTVDTVIGAWADNAAGACPTGAALACNDDNCGLQSLITFPVTAGSNYFLQIGSYNATVFYSGQFLIDYLPPPPANDDCNAPVAIGGSGLVPVDTTYATTGTQGQTETLCYDYATSAIQKDLWFTWTPTLTGPVTVTTCGQMTTDTRIAVYAGAGCPAAGSAIACNDDEGHSTSSTTYTCTAYNFASTVTFNATCGQQYTIQFGTYSNTVNAIGNFQVTESGTTCAPPATAYCFGDGSGTACPCGNAGSTGNGCANSINASGAHLGASGSASLSSDTLVLNGTGMTNSSVLYFQGDSQLNSGNGVAFGDGLRCAGTAVKRLGTKANVAGASNYPTGADPAIHIRGAVVAPGTKNYQAWYRNADPSFCTPSTFNLTNGLSVTWF